MVVLSELSSVFWGVALEGAKKKYTQTTTQPVHISMAALDLAKPSDAGPLSVMIEHSTGSYVLCTLQRGVLFQQPLNLDFAAGEDLSFYINGNGSIHLTGYVMPEDDYQQYSDLSDDEDVSEEDMGSDEEASSDDEADEEKTSKKRPLRDVGQNSKKAKLTLGDLGDEDEDDEDDDDFILDEAVEASDDDDEDEDSEEEVEESPKKTQSKVAVVSVSKKDQKKSVQQTPSSVNQQPKEAGEADGKKKKKKKKKNKNKGQEQQTAAATEIASPSSATTTKPPTKRVAEGGVVIEEVKQGHGPEAKLGKMVRVYYTGRLSNGKVFDACTNGSGFKFKLGKKEVISGWDIGVGGMKVGGKRKLIIPPKMGYGPQKAGPIPPNSTLVFDIELKAVG